MLVSVVIPVHNSAGALQRCLDAVVSSGNARWECIVVDDGSTDASAAVAAGIETPCPVRVLRLEGGPYGPAYARNRGAEAAAGDFLFFVDADVELHADAIARAAHVLENEPGTAAVFGSYDDSPDAQDFLSQYKNLFHHFVHQQSRPEAGTFWTGCGAIRRDIFLAQGGFDEGRYRRPSIEDIELGMRLRAAGHRIRLEHEMQAKHLKRWTLWSLLRADIRDRALPWTQLIHEHHDLPNDLNLSFSQRLSSLLLGAALLYFAALAPLVVTALEASLIAAFLLTAGYWDWSGRGAAFGSLPAAAGAVVSILILAAAILLWSAAGPLWLAPLLALTACMAVGQARVRRNAPVARRLFGAATLAWLLSAAAPLLTVPLWSALPPVVLMGLVVLINHRLYRFFLRKQGVVFTLAVIPFHFLYYTYSVIAFIAASAWHLLAGAQATRRTPTHPLRPQA